MIVPHRTRRVKLRPTRWMRVREVADRLGWTNAGVLAALSGGRIPGGEVLLLDARGRKQWRVLREAFEPWLAEQARRVLG